MKKNLTILIPVLILFLLSSCTPSTEELFIKAGKFQEQKEYKKAIEVYTKITKRNPQFQDAFFNKAYCYLQDSNYVKALQYLNIVLRMKGADKGYFLEMNPDSPFAKEEDMHQIDVNKIYHVMAIVKYDMDSLSAAYGLFQYLINERFETGNCLAWQGSIWVRYDSVSKACDFFQKAKSWGEKDADRLLKVYCQSETK